jgi:hypothetical protein
MQSSELWFKKLAKSSYSNGRWNTKTDPVNDGDHFKSFKEDLLEMLDIYNQHASSPIRTLCPQGVSNTLVTLMYGSTQMRLTQKDNDLDISLIVTRNFQTKEIPITRLTPKVDKFGSSTWHQGSTELSSEQVIKNIFIHLIEATDS